MFVSVQIRKAIWRTWLSILALGALCTCASLREVEPAVPPVVSAISQTSALAGSAELTLTVFGSGFGRDIHVQWNGEELTSLRVSNRELRVTVPARQLTVPGTAKIVVMSNSGSSTPTVFTVIANKSDVTVPGQRSAQLGALALYKIWKA